MNIKITYNWLKEYLDTDADPFEVQKYLSLCGPSVERVEKSGDDYVFDIEVTSNRVDTASVLGIAQEAQAILPLFGKKARLIENPRSWIFSQINAVKNKPLEYSIEDPELCSRFTAIILSNVTVGKSPDFIKNRLEACDIRSLNNVVDISNYIMLALGQPVHIFDYDLIKDHKMILRASKKGETVRTLDGREFKLPGNDIVIEDGSGRLIDLCGIMGGENSMVSDKTKNALLFIQTYNKRNIRKTSMTTGQRSVAATYFEKGLDEQLVEPALAYGVKLLADFAGAKIDSEIFDTFYNPYKPKKITVSALFISRMMGVEISADKAANILKNLGFDTEVSMDEITASVPSWRKDDIDIPQDIVEEVARVYGYHNLPNSIQHTTYVKQPKELDTFFTIQNKSKNLLKHLGLSEAMNYSMTSENLIKTFGEHSEDHLAIANTISEEIKFMRRSLIPSLTKNISDNKGKRRELRFFEIAKIYTPKKAALPDEIYKLAIAVNTDYYDLKGILEALLRELNIGVYNISPANSNKFFASVQAEISINDKSAGMIGKIKPIFSNELGISEEVFGLEIDFTTLALASKLLPSYRPPFQYAVVKLDHTHILQDGQTYADLTTKATKASGLLVKTDLVSRFENKITLRFHFNSDKENITEDLAKKELEKIIKSI